MKNLFINSGRSRSRSDACFGQFAMNNYENLWNHNYLSLMSMNTSNKSRLGRKIFEISSQLENMPINSPSVTDHFSHYDEWCGKAVASNSTLNLNTKYLLMQEIMNCVEYNKIYSPLKTGFLQEGPKMACIGTQFSANRKFYDPDTIVDLMLPPFIMFSSYERDSSV